MLVARNSGTSAPDTERIALTGNTTMNNAESADIPAVCQLDEQPSRHNRNTAASVINPYIETCQAYKTKVIRIGIRQFNLASTDGSRKNVTTPMVVMASRHVASRRLPRLETSQRKGRRTALQFPASSRTPQIELSPRKRGSIRIVECDGFDAKQAPVGKPEHRRRYQNR